MKKQIKSWVFSLVLFMSITLCTLSCGSGDGDNVVNSNMSSVVNMSSVMNMSTVITPFSLHANGITILCDNANISDSGVINGITYTKRVKDDINTSNAQTTCTSGVTNMQELFRNQNNFNQDISKWDVSSVTIMGGMFRNAIIFNQSISSWDVSSVTNMNNMFLNASNFNQNILTWCVSHITSPPFQFSKASPLSDSNKPRWNTNVASCQ